MPLHGGNTHHLCFFFFFFFFFSDSAGHFGTPNFRKERNVTSRIIREAGTGKQKQLTTGSYYYPHFTNVEIEREKLLKVTQLATGRSRT